MGIAIARKHEVFIVEESTKGTLVFPSASDAVVPAGYGTVSQNPSFTDSLEIKNTRDIIDRFRDRNPAGEWSLPVYCRPSGSAGTAPEEALLMKGLMGTETTVGGTSVTYSQALTKTSVSIWMKYDHTVFFASGATVGKLSVALANTGGLMFNFSGQFMKLQWVGTDAANGAVSATDTTVTVDNADRFCVGGKIALGSDDNAGSGYEITAVNYTTNVLTISPAAVTGCSDGDAITPVLPTGTYVGSALEARKGKANIATVDTAVKAMNIDITDQPQYLDDEITTSDYVEEYVETMRTINGKVSAYFSEGFLGYFYDALNNNQKNLKLICGDTAGSIVTFTMGQAEFEMPTPTVSDPTVAIDIPFAALGSSGEDSLTIAYT